MLHCAQQPGDPIWDALKHEVSRLAQLDGYPNPEFSAPAFRELVVALQNSDSLDDAKFFIDDVMMCEMVCPKPSQLRDMIRNARETKAAIAPSPNVDAVKVFSRYRQDSDPRVNEHLGLLTDILTRKLAKDHPARTRIRELQVELLEDYPHYRPQW